MGEFVEWEYGRGKGMNIIRMGDWESDVSVCVVFEAGFPWERCEI